MTDNKSNGLGGSENKSNVEAGVIVGANVSCTVTSKAVAKAILDSHKSGDSKDSQSEKKN